MDRESDMPDGKEIAVGWRVVREGLYKLNVEQKQGHEQGQLAMLISEGRAF